MAAQANVRLEGTIEPLQGSNCTSDFRRRAGPGRRTGGRGKDEPAERRLGRTERVAAMCTEKCEAGFGAKRAWRYGAVVIKRNSLV